MPTFRPPLYHTSEVITGETSSTPFAKLTFTVNLDNDEGVDGVYQLWTDLANVNDEGQPLYSPGEWHEITFAPLPSPPSSEGTASTPSASINLSPRPSPQLPSSSLYAVVHIASTPASYSYTHRQVKGSGDIVWLGSDGSNGSINVRHGDRSDQVVVDAGPWDGSLKNNEEVKWDGVAVVMDYHNRFSAPSIVQLPSTEPVRASLVVALGLPLADNLPFFQPTSDAKSSSSNITRSIAMAVASATKKGLDIPSSSILPEKSRQATYGRSETGSLSSAVLNALKEQPSPTLKLVDSSDTHVVLAPTKVERNSNADLVILSYANQSQNVSITRPSKLESTSPILCQVAASRRLLQSQSSSSSSSSVDIQLQSGFIAEVVRFTEMSELRIEGGDDSIWICAPEAQSVQVGEEEFGEPSSGKDVYQHDVSIVGESSEGFNDQSTVAGPTSEADTDLSRPVEINESEYEAGDEDDAPVSKKTEQMESFWLLRIIDSLLVRIWSWIFTPLQVLGSPQASHKRLGGAEDVGGEGQTETSSETRGAESSGSAADERTPLLTTPGLSRSTSSTFNSPLNSPDNSLTIKAKQTLDSFIDSDADNKQRQAKLPNGNGQYPGAGTVSIRSYTEFTFASPPPFAFFLPSETAKSWQDKIKFSLKTQTSAGWENAVIEVKGDEGGAVEVGVAGSQVREGELNGTTWQVQVERL